MSFSSLSKKPARYILGLSAGASCVGIDASLVRVKGFGPEARIKFIKHQHFPYTPGFQIRLLTGRKSARELSLLHFEMGERLAEAALDMLAIAQEESVEVDLIASSGFTVSHAAPRGPDSPIGTLQIGESAVIAERTELPVVSDFAARDLAAGGQGALLRPYLDWLLFKRTDHTVACLHLGGMARVTIVTPRFDEVSAFEIGPCCISIDGIVRLLSHGAQPDDRTGKIAGKGVVVDEFLDYLLDHPYFNRVPPKTTCRDEFGSDVYLRDAVAARRDHAMEDLVATVTSACAYSVIRAFSRFVTPQYDVDRVVVSGLGARNKTLVRNINNGLRDTLVRPTSRYGIPCEAVEALAVAVLGNETVCGYPSNVPSVTGARRPVILGKLTPA